MPEISRLCVLVLAILLYSCGSASLGFGELDEFINEKAPLQVWSGRVTAAGAAVPNAVVLITATPQVEPRADNETDEQFRQRQLEAEAERVNFSGLTDSDGEFSIFFRWYEDRLYSITAVEPNSAEPRTWSGGEPRLIRWQDQTTDLSAAQ